MSSELREALTAAGASALVPKIIEPVLLEYQRRYSPLCRAIPMVQWDADQYFFNTRTNMPAGGFAPDGGARPVSSSAYRQDNFFMKHIQGIGSVTGYAQAVTRRVIGDLRNTEIQGSIQGYYWDCETSIMWGNALATLNGAQPQFDGLDSLVSVFSGPTQNSIDKAGATLTTAHLDQLINMVQVQAAMPVFNSSWMIVCSPTAISKIAQLNQNQQRFNDQVEVAPGLLVNTYRRIPLVDTSFLSTASFAMSAVTTTTGTLGGSLPASTTYKYVVTAIMSRAGETLPCVEVSQATGGSTSTNIITLSFTAPAGAEGAAPILYKVYRTAANGASNSETFLSYVNATVGVQTDGVTPIVANQIIDTGTALIPQQSVGSLVPGQLPAAYIGANTSMFPPAPALESIFLISRDRNFVCRPYVREAQPLDVYPTTAAPDTLPYAIIGDTCLAVKAPKYTGRLSRVATGV